MTLPPGGLEALGVPGRFDAASLWAKGPLC